MTLVENRQKVLNDTISHYTLANRSKIKSACLYAPTPDVSEGCAIGRLITDKDLCRNLDTYEDTAVNQVFNHLPKDVKELGVKFLSVVQELHDNEDNWTDNGLSKSGRTAVESIKFQFSLN